MYVSLTHCVLDWRLPSSMLDWHTVLDWRLPITTASFLTIGLIRGWATHWAQLFSGYSPLSHYSESLWLGWDNNWTDCIFPNLFLICKFLCLFSQWFVLICFCYFLSGCPTVWTGSVIQFLYVWISGSDFCWPLIHWKVTSWPMITDYQIKLSPFWTYTSGGPTYYDHATGFPHQWLIR